MFLWGKSMVIIWERAHPYEEVAYEVVKMEDV